MKKINVYPNHPAIRRASIPVRIQGFKETVNELLDKGRTVEEIKAAAEQFIIDEEYEAAEAIRLVLKDRNIN